MTEKTDPLEMARCALANLRNLGKQVPGVCNHVIFKITEKQIMITIEELEANQ